MGDLEKKIDELSYLLDLKKNQEKAKRVCLKDKFKYKSEVGGILLKRDSNLHFHIVRSYYDRLIDFSHKLVDTGNIWYANRLITLVKKDLKLCESDVDKMKDEYALELLKKARRGEKFAEKRLITLCEKIASTIYDHDYPMNLPSREGKYCSFHVHTGQPPSNADLEYNNELVLSYKLFNGSKEFSFITAYFITDGIYEKIRTFR